MLLATESFSTVFTAVRSVSTVNQHMPLEVGHLETTHVAAHGRGIGGGVKALVLHELFAQSEATSTHGALVWSLAGMQQEMVTQQHRNIEPLTAERTGMAEVTRVGVHSHVLTQQGAQSE